MILPALATTALVTAAAVAFGSRHFSLSVGVGGVMGLANLWAWQRIVARLTARQAAEHAPRGALAAPLIAKFVGLAFVLLAISFLPVDLLGVGLGFGGALIGAVAAGLR